MPLVSSDIRVLFEELFIGHHRLLTRRSRLRKEGQVIALTITIEIREGKDRVARPRLTVVDQADGRSEVLCILNAVVELTDDAMAHIEVRIIELITIDVGRVVVLPVRCSQRRKTIISHLRLTEGIGERSIEAVTKVLSKRSGEVVAIPLIRITQQKDVGVLITLLTRIDRAYFSRFIAYF